MSSRSIAASPWSIAVACYATAVSATLFACWGFWWGLPESDGAKQGPLLLQLFNPFLLMLTLPMAIVGATVALPVAIRVLRGTALRASLPWVTGPTVLCAAACGAFLGPLNLFVTAPLTTIVAILALLFVRGRRDQFLPSWDAGAPRVEETGPGLDAAGNPDR